MPKDLLYEQQQTSSYRWVVLFASFFAFVVYAFVFQLVPPILSSLQSYFGVDEAQAGLLMSMAVIPGIFLALPAGLLVDKYGFRLIGFLSIISVAVGSFVTALANSFAAALLGRFILGIGAAFIIVGTPTVIPQWFRHEDFGKAMGVFGTNMPVATITAFPAATILAQNFGWRSPFYVGTAISLFCALLFAITMKEGPLKGEPEPLRTREVKQAIRTAAVWKVSLVWMFFNTTIIAFLSWAPTLFHEFKGLEPFYASLLSSFIMISAVLFVPVFGWASDKSGRRKPFVLAGSVLMALTVISTAYVAGLALLLSVGILGVSAAMVPPLTMAIVAGSLSPRLSVIGFSILALCQNIGITLSVPIAGYLLQTTQSLPITLLGISLFALTGALIALTIKTK